MLLTISTTRAPATDLSWLLHKHPDRVQQFSLSYGVAHVLYPEVTDERCTVALIMDLDPVQLSRGKAQGHGRRAKASQPALQPYVNDRPYVASSHTAVAIGTVFRTAMTGVCKGKQEIADEQLPLDVTIAVVRSRSGPDLIHELFDPLGYEIDLERHALDETFPDWGDSPYYTMRLRHAGVRLAELLRHLVVLLPVLDASKHYFVGIDEVDKLLARGEGWLDTHPARERIANSYLSRRRSLARIAIEQLLSEESADPDDEAEKAQSEEEEVERALSLNDQRLAAVLEQLQATGAGTVLDLGCGEGKLLQRLVADMNFRKVCGMDVSIAALERASRRLRLEDMSERRRERIELLHGSLMYRDKRIEVQKVLAELNAMDESDPVRTYGLAGIAGASGDHDLAESYLLQFPPDLEVFAWIQTDPAWSMVRSQGWFARISSQDTPPPPEG